MNAQLISMTMSKASGIDIRYGPEGFCNDGSFFVYPEHRVLTLEMLI